MYYNPSMEFILLAFMLFFAPGASTEALLPFARNIAAASLDPAVVAELFVAGRYEGLWGVRGVPMGVTAWARSHGRRPDPHEAVCAALASVDAATSNCGGGSRALRNRLGYYITGRCEALPFREVTQRAASVRAMVRVFRAVPRDSNQEMLTCPAGE